MYGAPSSGFYVDGSYLYFYDSITGTIKIVASPRGGAGTLVAKGTAPYTAIYRLIKGSHPATQAQVDSITKAAAVPASAIPSLGPTSITAPVADVVPFYKQPWFPPVVVLGLVAIVGGTLVLRKN